MLQERFLVANFNDRILNHPRIQKLEIELEEEIFEQDRIVDKIESAKQRRFKEITIEIEQKEAKYRKEKEKHVKAKHYSESGIDELKNDIQLLRVAIASMKSDYNIKIRKIDNDIKNDKKKCKQLENKADLGVLKDRFSQLERAKIQQ